MPARSLYFTYRIRRRLRQPERRHAASRAEYHAPPRHAIIDATPLATLIHSFRRHLRHYSLRATPESLMPIAYDYSCAPMLLPLRHCLAGYARDTLRRLADTPASAAIIDATPLRHITPPMYIRQITPSAITPLRHYAITPLRRATPLRQPAATPAIVTLLYLICHTATPLPL